MQFYKINPLVHRNAFFPTVILVLAILLSSCENEEEQNMSFEESQLTSLLFDKVGIEKAELKKKLAYKNYHLTFLMEEVLQSNPDFDEQEITKSSKKGHMGASYFKDLLGETLKGKGKANLSF